MLCIERVLKSNQKDFCQQIWKFEFQLCNKIGKDKEIKDYLKNEFFKVCYMHL